MACNFSSTCLSIDLFARLFDNLSPMSFHEELGKVTLSKSDKAKFLPLTAAITKR